ncbi:MAG: DNA methyltransferase [Pararobbsia sp.]
MDFENEGGETYICGNPPYKGATEQNSFQKDDMHAVFGAILPIWKSFDYILGFFQKARSFLNLLRCLSCLRDHEFHLPRGASLPLLAAFYIGRRAHFFLR